MVVGIFIDYECFIFEEVCYKVKLGMKIFIWEGSVVWNFDVFILLIREYLG